MEEKETENTESIDEDIDFSFRNVEEKVDRVLQSRKKKQDEEEVLEFKTPNLSDKTKKGLEIRNNLPDPGFLEVKFDEVKVTTENEDGSKKVEKKIKVTHKDVEGKEHVEVTNGIYKLDLRNDATFWFLRTPEVIPQRTKQAIRAAIDRKKCYEPMKRKLDVPYILVIILIVGAIIIAVSFMSWISG